MRTTLDIDDDVLAAAERLASSKKTTAGKVISEWARHALAQLSAPEATWQNGFLVWARRPGEMITPELIARLAADEQ